MFPPEDFLKKWVYPWRISQKKSIYPWRIPWNLCLSLKNSIDNVGFAPKKFPSFWPLPLKNSTVPQPGGVRIINGIAQWLDRTLHGFENKISKIIRTWSKQSVKQFLKSKSTFTYCSVFPGLVKSIWSPRFGLNFWANFRLPLANRRNLRNLNAKRLFVAFKTSMSSFLKFSYSSGWFLSILN